MATSIMTVGSTALQDVTTLFGWVATGIIAYLLIKWLAPARTFLAALVAVLAAAALNWVNTASQGDSFAPMMTQTWQTWTSGAGAAGGKAQEQAPAPAPKG